MPDLDRPRPLVATEVLHAPGMRTWEQRGNCAYRMPEISDTPLVRERLEKDGIGIQASAAGAVMASAITCLRIAPAVTPLKQLGRLMSSVRVKPRRVGDLVPVSLSRGG